ncbi:MAG: DNA gyrase subunit A [Firmicutes bacterium]|nr:DNA gyrase subunit A [Bacillota bacterium]
MTPTTDRVIMAPIEDEMKESYLDYAMSVIVSRALPDVRDGLKPVHRRILYSMNNQGLTPDKPFKKSATIVGDVIGKYHPHGDVAVYDSLVRMAQDFNMRSTLVEGHGNFGSVDGDPPAAYRYTEARMSRIATELLDDLDKETVDFRPNFDNSHKEPVVLPGKYPNLIVNGSSGIAVGMATNIPPHNLSEVVDGVIKLIDKPETTGEELLKIIPAPDFPTGANIMGLEGAKQAHLTGRGSVTMRAKATIEETKGHRHTIIINEIPYQVKESNLLQHIASAVNDKRIKGISDLRDESDRNGMRIVIELQAHANPQVVLNQLYKRSDLQTNFGVIMLALVDGVPRVLTLKQCLEEFLKHRRIIVRRRAEFDLRKAKDRAHILEGLQIALDNIDAVIETIRKSQKVDEAREALVKKFKLSEVQAQAILEMRLQRLTGLERQKIQEEYGQLMKTIASLQDLLASEQKILAVIKDELIEIKKKYGDKRRSQILLEEGVEFEMEDLIPEEEVAITITHSNYIKRLPSSTYKSQKRGGRGIMGVTMKEEEDFLDHIFVTTTHHFLLFFTNRARVYRVKVYEVPEASRQAKGTHIANLIPIEQGKKRSAVFTVKDFESDKFLFMATKNGIANKTALKGYANIRKGGIYAIKLDEGDELVGVQLTSGKQEIILISKKGMSIRFPEEEVRPTGRMTRGVRGIRLRTGDEVVSMDYLTEGKQLLVVTENGYGKRTTLVDYRLQSRGGVGVKTLKVTAKNGEVVGAKVINPEEEIILTTSDGNIIRIEIEGISSMGRGTQGVILVKLEQDCKVSGLAILSKNEVIATGEEV